MWSEALTLGQTHASLAQLHRKQLTSKIWPLQQQAQVDIQHEAVETRWYMTDVSTWVVNIAPHWVPCKHARCV